MGNRCSCLVVPKRTSAAPMHGLAGKTRTILGGTVTREAFYSAVREEAARVAGVPAGKEVGVPSDGLAQLGHALGSGLADLEMATQQLRTQGS